MRLTGVDTAESPLGDGTTFVIGPSSFPIPTQTYMDAADALYLHPHGFGGTTQPLFTPAGLYPLSGVKSLPFDTSAYQAQQILDATIHNEITGGRVDSANPAVVFGFSQSTTPSSLTMSQLASQGVPSGDVHFILVGDLNNPDGGLLERLDVPAGTNPQIPSLGLTFSGATPADLYPTDIYTQEYDGFADFPQYPLNFVSDLNAFIGVLFKHFTYMDLAPEQIDAAIQLPTSAADTMTNYYMIPSADLPLLDPLRLIPVIGQPLYDLLEPDTRILVNLGYGSITDGWGQGNADVPTSFGLWPTNIDPAQLFTAFANGAQHGITAAIKDLQNPDTYQVPNVIADPASSPVLSTLVSTAYTMGLTDTPHASLLDLLKALLSGFAGFPISDATLLSSPTDIVNALSATISADYASLLPAADTITALLTSIPAYDATIVVDQLGAGNVVDAIADPIAADFGLVPFAAELGAVRILEAAGGTLINLADLFDLSGHSAP